MHYDNEENLSEEVMETPTEQTHEAAEWLGRQTVAQTRGFTPASQTAHNQPTNSTSYHSQLNAACGCDTYGLSRSLAYDAVAQAGANARPPGSWQPRPAAWTS